MADPADALGFGRESTHDYEGRPPDRWSRPWSPTLVMALTVVGALVVGFLLSSALSAGRNVAVSQHERRDELVSLINAREDRADALREQLDDLRAEVAAAEAAAATGVPALQEQVGEVEMAAGMTAVSGPGLRVTLGDAAPDCSDYEENCRIHDSDIQLAVNALFAAGAEAVAVNGERVIATTAIRGAGRTIQVNYRPLGDPYTIEAVGDPEHLAENFLRSEFADLFVVWEDLYGLGFDLEEHDDLEIPGFGGSVRLREAAPAQGGSS